MPGRPSLRGPSTTSPVLSYFSALLMRDAPLFRQMCQMISSVLPASTICTRRLHQVPTEVHNAWEQGHGKLHLSCLDVR